MDILSAILNNALYVTILVIVISSLINFYAKSRARDRCLRDFDDYRVALETREGKVIWGALRAYSSGIELLYASTHEDTEGHLENSYILYANEVAAMQALYRFHDHQTEKAKQKRERDIRRTYQPNIFRRMGRALRNLFSAFKDAIVQTLNAILGSRAAQRPEDLVLSKHKDLTASGATLIGGTIGNAYEPILERYIGQYVVLELVRNDQIVEEYGILKEYSTAYVELLNAKLEVPLLVYTAYRPPTAPPPLLVKREGDTVRVTNALARPLVVQALRWGRAESRTVSVPIDPGDSATIELLAEPGGAPVPEDASVEMEASVHCLADLIVPRALSVVRHAGKREKLSAETLMGLDDLPQLPWLQRLIDVRAWGQEPTDKQP